MSGAGHSFSLRAVSIRSRRARLAALLLALAAAACSLLSDEGAVWQGTRIYVPWSASADGKPIEATVAELVQRGQDEDDPLAGLLVEGARLPVVVFLHGCSGEMAGIPEEFEKRGFVVLAPWSFARTGRPQSCGDVGPETLAWRLDEARWTVARLAGLPWVDPHGIAVVGASEGGLAVAQYADAPPVVAAFVIMGWTCTDRNNIDFNGVRVPGDRAVYAVIGARDPLVASPRLGGDCTRSLAGRAHAESRVIDGLAHAVPDKPVFDDIAAFIEAARRRS